MPLSRMQTLTPAPVAPSRAQARSTRSGHSRSIPIRATACRGSDHAGSSSSSSAAPYACTWSSTPTILRRLEQLLELHGGAHVALDLQLARHVGRRRVLLAVGNLRER